MYIKSIKTQGFKSFADKIELDFNKGISAVVGPNGSGKSNIVDAILWVMGEQSVKTLRGDSQMVDVIFSGSKTREALKKASVAITFDNSDKRLNAEFNEIEVKRVIYQNGENEYYINNARVRNKDIQNLLLDVTSKFNIITQGNINALVENKSSERRILFESAAGVLKYKKRKEETIKKLEGTKENITRIDLIIKELNTSLKPLEKQKNDAEKYIKVKEELEQIDIALIASDITNLTSRLDEIKNNIKVLNEKLEQIDIIKPEEYEKKKVDLLKINDELSSNNERIIELNKIIAHLESQKQINLERNKYQVNKESINIELLNLKENALKIERDINSNKSDINNKKEKLQEIIKKYNIETDNELKLKIKITNLKNGINILNKDILLLQNKINIEKANLENNSMLPKSVNSILNNPRLDGIHNTIGALIEVNEAHLCAINTALGANINFLVVDNQNSAKMAINYLKDNNLGRATFFPIDTIKSRHITKDIEYTLKEFKGFIGVASDVITFKPTYKDIIENQLGNVLIVDNMDAMFTIAKKLDYKYKMVTLDGEIIYPGGSISGGNLNKDNHKININSLIRDLDTKKTLLNNDEMELEKEENNHDKLLSNIDEINHSISLIKYEINNIDALNKDLEESLIKTNNDLKDLNALNNSKLDEEIELIIKETNKNEEEKRTLELSNNTLKSKQFDLNNDINTIEKEININNSEYHKCENDIKNNQIESGKLEVKLDMLLNNLSEDYNITYEYALNNYTLNLEESLARNKVIELKNSIKGLTNINIGSINEYERLKKRYDFLDKQRNDLEMSSKELLNIIDDMDNIMKTKFKETFDKISKEFSNIFRTMFKGGNGILKLTDENDMLNTGISILAVPPGKKLNSTAALSGGEKALTAICLIFAILSVKPTPFIVLDEVEAALDEENVNMFGEYLSSLKDKSQFILITHKKKMMEYADILYGITMQESGVSKLVSVKLED